jgi:glucosamine--fructose-6-phosphate aminotransferase (isomerizing)
MSPSLHVVEGPYVSDIVDQPRALEETHRRLASSPPLDGVVRRVIQGAYERVVMTGMGSSLHGLHPLHLRLVDAGVPAVMIDSSELLHYQRRLLEKGTLLVVVSQSGRSAEIVRLLDVAGDRVETLGVTNTPDSPLAARASAVLLTHAGEEATVACKTHLAAQMALAWLGTLLTGGDPEETRRTLAAAIPAVRSYVEDWRAHVGDLADLLEGVRALYFVGRGPSLGTVYSAGLIAKEATHRPSEGLGSAAFRHGPMELLDDGIFVLVFAGEDRTRALNEALVDDARAAGARAFLVAEDTEHPALRLPEVPSLARPLVEILPVEMLTLAIPALDGREAGTFRIGGKVTTVE